MKLKVNSTHGGRGPQPKTFERWVLAASKRGAQRFRVHLADGSTKLVAHKSAPDSAKRMTAMEPKRVQALDDKDAELGEWSFAEKEEELAQVEPEDAGYIKDGSETELESMIKTFAHLLADAHRLALQKLVEVVSIQSKHFSEERRNLLSLNLANERMLARRLRGPLRVRVADDGEGGEEDTADAEPGEDNAWLRELLEPMIARMAQKAGAHVADGIAGEHKNGEAKETKS